MMGLFKRRYDSSNVLLIPEPYVKYALLLSKASDSILGDSWSARNNESYAFLYNQDLKNCAELITDAIDNLSLTNVYIQTDSFGQFYIQPSNLLQNSDKIKDECLRAAGTKGYYIPGTRENFNKLFCKVKKMVAGKSVYTDDLIAKHPLTRVIRYEPRSYGCHKR